MPNWMDELDELTKGMKGRKPAPDDEDDTYDGDGDGNADMDGDGEDDDECPPARPVRKSANTEAGNRAKGNYPAAPNGDDDDEEGEAAVRDPEVLDRNAAQRGGKKQKNKFPTGPKQVTKSVRDYADTDTEDVIDASPALECLVKAIDAFGAQILRQVHKSLAAVREEIDAVTDGQAIIGRAVAKGLTSNQDILKSLAGEVEEIAKQPAGRKAVTKGVERKFAGSDQPKQMDRGELMEKSLAALRAGRITVLESAKVDSYMNHGQPLPPALLAKITGS